MIVAVLSTLLAMHLTRPTAALLVRRYVSRSGSTVGRGCEAMWLAHNAKLKRSRGIEHLRMRTTIAQREQPPPKPDLRVVPGGRTAG